MKCIDSSGILLLQDKKILTTSQTQLMVTEIRT